MNVSLHFSCLYLIVTKKRILLTLEKDRHFLTSQWCGVSHSWPDPSLPLHDFLSSTPKYVKEQIAKELSQHDSNTRSNILLCKVTTSKEWQKNLNPIQFLLSWQSENSTKNKFQYYEFIKHQVEAWKLIAPQFNKSEIQTWILSRSDFIILARAQKGACVILMAHTSPAAGVNCIGCESWLSSSSNWFCKLQDNIRFKNLKST